MDKQNLQKKNIINNMSSIINPITKRKIKIKTLSKRLRDGFYKKNEIKQIQDRLKINKLGYNSKSKRIVKSNNRELIKQLKIDYNIYIINNDGDIARLNQDEKPLIYQEFGIPTNINASSSKKELKNINIKFTDKLDSEQAYNLRVAYEVVINYSGPNDVIRQGVNTGKFKPNEIENEMKNYIFNKYNASPFQVKSLAFNVFSPKLEQEFELIDMELRDHSPSNLCNLYNEVIENKNGHCISNYLSKIYNKFSKKEISKLKNTRDILNYCKNNNIKMICYDITGNIIASNYPIKHNKSRKSLIYIAHNNHLYPLKNESLKKVNKYTEGIPQFCDDLDKKFNSIIESGFMPSKLTLDFNNNISSFYNDSIIYHKNEEYEICKKILTKFGLLDNLTIFTTLKTIGDTISKLYIKKNINSFIPHNDVFCKGAFYYNNETILNKYNKKDLITIDKNKCYSYILKNLDFLINCDVKTHRIKTYDNNNQPKVNEIIDHYLYIVKPKYSNILLPHQNIYSGIHLKYCLNEGVKFKFLEVLETRKTENFYTDMINDLYDKCDQKTFKSIVNVMIGKFEKYCDLKKIHRVSKIVNEDEKNTCNEYSVKLNNDLYAILEEQNKFDIFNKKPISIQIKDQSRVLLYEKMKELKLTYKNIIQIKTDSITFLNTNKRNYKKSLTNDIDGWKLENYNSINSSNFNDIPFTFKYIADFDNENILGNCYAGCGKSYKIVNEYLKDEKINKDYIILTPSHATLKYYRKEKYNCDVIQKYTLNNKIPNEKTVIIDEIGMIDSASWNLLYKCKLLKKNIIAYGDKNQLLPVGCDNDLFSKNFLNCMFKEFDKMTTNYRNNFTKEYYDSLINSTNDNYLIEESLKYNTKNYYNSDVIIAYRNSTREKYNKLMCEYNNIKNKTDLNALLICNSNKLGKYNIYNKFTMKVIDKIDNLIILTDGLINYKLDEEQINKNFDYGYCRTLYSVQGESLKSYYYCAEDKYFLNNRSSYTLISRLKIDT